MKRTWTAVLLIAFVPSLAIPEESGTSTAGDAAGKGSPATLDGPVGSGRQPHRWVYAADKNGITARDPKTGRVVWHARGSTWHILLSGDMLFATDEGLDRGPWLTARAAASGVEAFRVRLPPDDGFEFIPISEVAGLLLVQSLACFLSGEGEALLIDRRGRVRHRFTRQVIAGVCQGEDRVFLTGSDVVRVSPADTTRWATSFKERRWAGDGGLVRVGGDLVAFLYCGIADSGVQLVRLNAATGKVAWRACCDRLGVGHSKYRHDATVAVDGNRLRVMSVGSYGTFVEILDLRTGKQLRRTRSDP